jgi:hypothetical protein
MEEKKRAESMTAHPDLRSVDAWGDFIRRYTEDREVAKAMYGRARRFLESFAWCGGIEQGYVGILQSDIVAVFLFKIRPARPDVDEWLWVVVGDLPSAYLVCENSPDPVMALEGYIEEMSRWVDAVENGRPVDGLIPTRVDPTPKYAAMLKSRLGVLDRYLRSELAEGLKDGDPFE